MKKKQSRVDQDPKRIPLSDSHKRAIARGHQRRKEWAAYKAERIAEGSTFWDKKL